MLSVGTDSRPRCGPHASMGAKSCSYWWTWLGRRPRVSTGASGTMTFNDVPGAATYDITTTASNGTVALDATSGVWTYTPTANWYGTDSFTLRATGSNPSTITDSETVTVTVTDDGEKSANVHGGALQRPNLRCRLGSLSSATSFCVVQD